MSTIVNVHEAKTHFSRLLDKAHAGEEIILETAVGHARVGCGAVGWQGATTRRATARKTAPGHKQS
jgi:hypothetical protein